MLEQGLRFIMSPREQTEKKAGEVVSLASFIEAIYPYNCSFVIFYDNVKFF